MASNVVFIFLDIIVSHVYLQTQGITTGHKGSNSNHFRDLASEVKFMVYKLASNLTPYSNKIGYSQIKKNAIKANQKTICHDYKNKNFRTPSPFKRLRMSYVIIDQFDYDVIIVYSAKLYGCVENHGVVSKLSG